MRTTIDERETSRGQYDMPYDRLIVDHPKHGRLLLVQGFGWIDDLSGGAYRWEHGGIAKILPCDTLDGLSHGEWNESTSLLQAVVAGYDDSRPVLDWSGNAIAHLASAALNAS